MDQINLVYITCGDMEEARNIGRVLVETRFAACVNIIDNMNSIYRWDGKIQDDREVIMLAKTTSEKLPELIEKVKSVHSYECPCILSFPVSNGNTDFMSWISAEVNG